MLYVKVRSRLSPNWEIVLVGVQFLVIAESFNLIIGNFRIRIGEAHLLGLAAVIFKRREFAKSQAPFHKCEACC